MPKLPTTPETCFVIMPFSKPFDSCYRNVIVPAIRKAGLKPVRADEINKPGVILNQIWKGITEAQVCLADVTGRNANVMYELGLAHAVGKPVVQLVQDARDLPFDLRSLRHIEYRTTAPKWAAKLRGQIESMLTAVISDPSYTLAIDPQLTSFQGSSFLEYHNAITKARKRIWICQTWLPGVERDAEEIMSRKIRDTRLLLASFKGKSPIFARIAGRNISVPHAKSFVKNSVKRFVGEHKEGCLRFNYGHHPGWIAIVDYQVFWGSTPVHIDNQGKDLLFNRDRWAGEKGTFWRDQFLRLWRGFSHSYGVERKYNKQLEERALRTILSRKRTHK